MTDTVSLVNEVNRKAAAGLDSTIFRLVIGIVATLFVAAGALAPAATPSAGQTAGLTGVLSGRVVDPKGNPIADAQVMINGPGGEVAKTDAEGKYSFATVLRDGTYRIGVTANGFLPIEPYNNDQPGIQISAKSQAHRDLTMQRGVAIHVTVNDLLGAPVPGAQVYLCLSNREFRGRSDQMKQTSRGGIATFAVAPSPVPYIVAVSMDDHEPVHEIVNATSMDEPKDAELTLLPSTPIKGVAICNDGKPASGWTISAAPEWWVSNYIPRQDPIDKDGNFTLTQVGPGPYKLTVWKKNMGTQAMSIKLPPTSQPWRLDLPYPSPASLATLTGRVRVTGGRPPYIQVSAMGVSGGSWANGSVNFDSNRGKPGSTTQRAVVEGTFTVSDMTPGVYRITFQSQDIEAKVVEDVKVPGEMPVVELNMTGKPHLRGTVVDGATGKPVTQYSVRARKTESIGNGPNYTQDNQWSQVSNPSGSFDIELVGPGVYKAQIQADGYAWAMSDGTRIEGSKASPVQIKLSAGGTVSGQVVDPAGAAVSGASVIPLSMNRIESLRGDPRFSGNVGAVISDAQGHFTISHLAPGEESIKVVSDHFAPLVVHGLEIHEGTTTDAGAVKLLVGGTVEGTVYDDRGNAAPGVTLQFSDDYAFNGEEQRVASQVGTAATDAAGHYRLEHLPQDVMYVDIGDRWQRQGVVRRIVRPVDGKTAHLDFGGTTPVKGRLVLGGKPASGTRVELSVNSEYFGAVMVTAMTDSDGRFTFCGPPPGTYTLFYMTQGEQSRYARVRDVKVADQPGDLGDISIDLGHVTVTVQADDPADAKTLKYASILPDVSDQAYRNPVGPLVRDGASETQWIAAQVPAGKLRASIGAGTTPNMTYSASFERIAGAAETAVTVHVPRASAQLTLTITGDVPAVNRGWRYVMLRSSDMSISAHFGTDKSAPIVGKLPPGTYQVMNGNQIRARTDVPPIELKAGESKVLEIPLLSPDQETKRSVSIDVWTPDGLPVLGAVIHLADAQGKAIDPAGPTETNPYYLVLPGHYRATVDRAGAASFVADVDVPETKDRASRAQVPVHLTLP